MSPSPLFGEGPLQGSERLRSPEKESLSPITANLAQDGELCFSLHSVGDHRQTEGMCQVDHGCDHRCILSFAQPGDEVPVDLQAVYWQFAEVREGGVADPEVVDRQAHAKLVELLEHRLRDRALVDEHPFGDLDRECLGRKLILCEQVRDESGKARIGKLGSGDVDRHADLFMTALPPFSALAQGDLEDPGTECVDRAALFGQGNELFRGNGTNGGMLPPQQRLHRYHHATWERSNRLEVHRQLIASKGSVQTIDELCSTSRPLVEVRVINLESRTSTLLRHVHGAVCPRDESLRIVSGLDERNANGD